MKPVLLCYNLPDNKLSKLRIFCIQNHIRILSVRREWFSQPIEELLIAPQGEIAAPKFSEEMILFAGFPAPLFNLTLNRMRSNALPQIDLKAVLTETNKHWSSEALYEELLKEREAFRSGSFAHKTEE